MSGRLPRPAFRCRNGRSHGETGINALLVGSYGAPVVLASGDAAA
ncbi:M55 family metallopeptidase [[Actinomadura] parvosata]